MGLNLVGSAGRVDKDDFTLVVVVEEFVVHVALQSVQSVVCRPIRQNATNLGSFAVYIENWRDGEIAFEPSFLSNLPKVRSKNGSTETGYGWNTQVIHWKKRGQYEKKTWNEIGRERARAWDGKGREIWNDWLKNWEKKKCEKYPFCNGSRKKLNHMLKFLSGKYTVRSSRVEDRTGICGRWTVRGNKLEVTAETYCLKMKGMRSTPYPGE